MNERGKDSLRNPPMAPDFSNQRRQPGNDRDRIRAARSMPSRAFTQGVRDTLANLPAWDVDTRRQTRLTVAAAWAAGALLFIALAGPPIARAAGALWQRLFATKVEEIKQEQALPDAERALANLADGTWMLGSHAVGAAASAGDVTVVLDNYSLFPHMFDASRGWVHVGLRFPDAPEGFDPAWLDYTLETPDGAVPMDVDAALSGYREGGKIEKNPTPWGNVYWVDGEMWSEVYFAYDAWDADQKTDFVLTAEINGEPLRIPFTYDSALAHAAALRSEQARLPMTDAMRGERLQTMEQLAANAVPVGETVVVDGITVTLSELSVVGGEMHFSFMLEDEATKAGLPAEVAYRVSDFLIDGLKGAQSDASAERRDDGSLLLLVSEHILRDPRKLPEESLICVNFEHRMDGFLTTQAPIVFRYRWQEKTARLPADAAEKAAWLAESAEMAKRWPEESTTAMLHAYGWAPEERPAQTAAGMTLTLKVIEFMPQLNLYFDNSDGDFMSCDLSAAQASFGGLPAKLSGVAAGENMLILTAMPQIHPAELDGPATLAMDFTLDGTEEAFHFDVEIDPAKMEYIDRGEFSRRYHP